MGKEINLDEIGANNNVQASTQESIIGKVNESNGNTEGETSLDIDQQIDLRNKAVDIHSNSKRTRAQRQSRNLILLAFVIIITSTLGIFAFKYNKYLENYGNGIEENNKIADTYEKIKEKIYTIIGKEYSKPNVTIDIKDESGKSRLRDLIQNNNGYIYKKEVIKSSLTQLKNNVIENNNNLNQSKKDISTNGFFPQRLGEIISDTEFISSIQDSLTAIETVKFSSAITVFSKLDTFINQLATELGGKYNSEQILNLMENISKRGDKDINTYIKNCYLNAYELGNDCNNIGDFDKYYELTEDSEIDRDFFKKLISFIDDKLGQTEIPSFSIKFDRFVKQSNQLNFNIEINTFKEDEMELTKKGILYPHSFILNNLINNLKLSRYIVSEGIEVKSIDIVQRTINLGTTELTINTSSKSFSVPIKSNNQIEIDDFTY